MCGAEEPERRWKTPSMEEWEKERERSWEAFLSSVTYNEGNNLTFTFRSTVKFKAQLITVHMTTN